MSTKPFSQLAFSFGEENVQLVVTRPLSKHRRRNNLLRKLHYVRRFFPELAGRTLRVGITRAASGMAVPGGDQLWINPAQTTYHSLAHELVHLLQGQYDIPSGERSCDVFALARHWTLNDSPPYYVRLPTEYLTTGGNIRPECARLIYDVARGAVEMRETGMRNYISHFEKTLESLKGKIEHPRDRFRDE